MTIPKIAWPVVEEIRKHVPKPKELPTTDWILQGIREEGFGATLGWNCGKCPMGFLPYASSRRPNNVLDFEAAYCPFGTKQIMAFWEWWDRQKNAQKAVAEVWERSLSE